MAFVVVKDVQLTNKFGLRFRDNQSAFFPGRAHCNAHPLTSVA